MLLEVAEAVTVDVVFAVFLMVFIAVTAAVAVAILVTVSKLVLTPCRRSDVSGAVSKGVGDGNVFATCRSAGAYVSDCWAGGRIGVSTYADSATAVNMLSRE